MKLISIKHSNLYRELPPEGNISEIDLLPMRLIDETHTARPTWGYRTITKVIKRGDKIIVNRKKIRRLMKVMSAYTIYTKLNLRKGIMPIMSGHFF